MRPGAPGGGGLAGADQGRADAPVPARLGADGRAARVDRRTGRPYRFAPPARRV